MEPRPAATVILLRRSGRHRERGLEVLLVKRNPRARFMPGVWVFPGGAVDECDAAADEEARHRLCAIRELREEAGIELPSDAELVPFSRWITPEPVPVRFDTRFYLALAPPHSPPRPDGSETVEAGWYAPTAALESSRRGELQLVFPTIRNLEALTELPSSDAAIEAARGRTIEPILPRVLGSGDERRVVMPGDPGY